MNHKNSSKTWSLIKSITSFGNKSGNSVLKLIHNNQEYIISKNKSNLFIEYLSEITGNLESNLIYSNVHPTSFINVNGSHYQSLFLIAVTPIECENIFNLS